MAVAGGFGLNYVSERTIEINILNELASFLYSRFNLTITAISPTQNEENTLCFDDVLEGLPPGRVIAIQFKRPHLMQRPPNVVKFIASTRQLSRLSQAFQPNEAFLFLTPITTNQALVNNRLSLLRLSVAVDIQTIPNVGKRTQETRTIRVYPPQQPFGIPRVSIADPRKYEDIPNVTSISSLAREIAEGEKGLNITDDKESRRDKKIGVRKLKYLHIGEAE